MDMDVLCASKTNSSLASPRNINDDQAHGRLPTRWALFVLGPYVKDSLRRDHTNVLVERAHCGKSSMTSASTSHLVILISHAQYLALSQGWLEN